MSGNHTVEIDVEQLPITAIPLAAILPGICRHTRAEVWTLADRIAVEGLRRPPVVERIGGGPYYRVIEGVRRHLAIVALVAESEMVVRPGGGIDRASIVYERVACRVVVD